MSSDAKAPRPSITAPLSRFLAVADLDRSVAFYREVLGFDARPTRPGATAEVSRGPARIQLGVGTEAIDSTGQTRPRGTAMLFFETDDVAAMREAVIAHGGKPTALEKVNWIKMQMFQLTDPDGHTLWFGKSFQEPDHQRPEPMLLQILPKFPLTNVPAGVVYYRDVLGFSINYAQDDFGVMERDKATILLVPRSEELRGIGSCYVYVRDADALHTELTASGAKVQGAPVSRPWGLRDFTVLDLEGNEISFGQPFE
jgi:predicted enzyme related to lactoylglutathione lyase